MKKNDINVSAIIALRKGQNLTQKDMAEILKISKITYSQKEQGLINFTVTDLINIKRNFNIKIDDLVD